MLAVYISVNANYYADMDSATELKDYLIADEIKRISSLSKKELVEELIDLKSKNIEQMSDDEILLSRLTKSF